VNTLPISEQPQQQKQIMKPTCLRICSQQSLINSASELNEMRILFADNSTGSLGHSSIYSFVHLFILAFI
jgi:hypothetical protein